MPNGRSAFRSVISGGLFGLVLVTTGLSLWLSADMRDEWRALRRIENELAALRALQEASASVGTIVDRPIGNRK